jgi:hypothetical protein
MLRFASKPFSARVPDDDNRGALLRYGMLAGARLEAGELDGLG